VLVSYLTLRLRACRTTPLIFLAKFIFKLHSYGSDRAVVIKMPLVRNVMIKGGLAVFRRSRDEQRSSRRSALTSRRSSSRRSAVEGPQEGQVEEAPGTTGTVPHS